MKLPKNYFNNLSASKYREYLRLLPNMQQENTRIITTLIITFFALTFFGIFAINPTITTIIELKRKLADSQLVYEKLQTKIANLSSLQSQYNSLSSDLPLVFEAIPQNPEPAQLLAQILSVAEQKGVSIQSLETSGITLLELSDIDKLPPAEVASTQIDPIQTPEGPISEDNLIQDSFNFTLQAQGSYENLIEFANSLSKIQRVIKIDSMSISLNSEANNLAVDIGGSAYYKE